MENINLLPEDLKKEEGKIASAGSTPPPLNLYIPQNKQKENLPKNQVIEPASHFNESPKKIVDEIQKPSNPTPNPVANSFSTKQQTSSLDDMDKEVLLKNQERKKSFSNLFSSNKNKTKGKIIKNEIDHSSVLVKSKPFNVNLIPEGFNLISNKKLYAYFLRRAVYAVILVVAVYIGLTVLSQILTKKDQDLSTSLTQAQAKFQVLQKENNSLIASTQQFSQLESLFKAHIYWTKFFSALEKITIPDVYYNDINASLDGTVSISAMAENYLGVAKQYLVYQSNPETIEQVNISGLSGSEEEGDIKFSITLKVKPELFLNNPVKQ